MTLKLETECLEKRCENKILFSITATGIYSLSVGGQWASSSYALRGLIEAFPPTGVSHIPVAGMVFHSQRLALLFWFIRVNFIS